MTEKIRDLEDRSRKFNMCNKNSLQERIDKTKGKKKVKKGFMSIRIELQTEEAI